MLWPICLSLSVCHTGVLLKRMNIGSRKQLTPHDSPGTSFPGAKDLMFDNTDNRPTLWYSIGSLASQLASLVGSEMPLILVPI